MSQEEVEEPFADATATAEETTNKKGPYDRTSVFTFTGNLPQKNVLEKVTPAFVGIKTHGEFPVELMKTKRKQGENVEKGENVNLTTIDFTTIVDPLVKRVRLGWLFFVFPGLAALHTSNTSKQLIDDFQNKLLQVIETQDKMTNEEFIDTIQKLQFNYLLVYIPSIIPDLIQLFTVAIIKCEDLWDSEIEGDLFITGSELEKGDTAEITREFHSYMEAMTDYHNILHALMFEPQSLIRFAKWDNYDPNCPPIPIKKFLTSITLLQDSQNNDWDITIQSLPPITTGNLTPDVASIADSGVVASVFTGAELQTVLPDFVCGPGCRPQVNGDIFIMSDHLLREIYKRYSLGILVDSTCAHTRYQYKRGTYSVVDQEEVNKLQRQFNSLINPISIQITVEQAERIAITAQNAFIRNEVLISLLKRSHDLVSKMIPKIKSENKNKKFTIPEQQFLALYKNALKTSEELETLIVAARAEHRFYDTGAATAAADDNEEDMNLGGSRHKRSKRRKNGSKKTKKYKKKIRRAKAKKTKKRCKRHTKKRIRK